LKILHKVAHQPERNILTHAMNKSAIAYKVFVTHQRAPITRNTHRANGLLHSIDPFGDVGVDDRASDP